MIWWGLSIIGVLLVSVLGLLCWGPSYSSLLVLVLWVRMVLALKTKTVIGTVDVRSSCGVHSVLIGIMGSCVRGCMSCLGH